MDTSQTAVPAHGPDLRVDPYAEAVLVVSFFSDLLGADRVGVEHDPIVSLNSGDVPDDLDQMFSGDVGTDGVGVADPCRTPRSVGGQQNPAFEYELSVVSGAGQRSRKDSSVCRIRYSCVGALPPLLAAVERAAA